MRFAVFTHVIHHKNVGNYCAYSPYVREMNLWLKFADTVEIVAPRPLPIAIGTRGEPISGEAYHHSDLIFTTIPNFHLLSPWSAIKAIFSIPIIFFRILGAMRRADHLHLRCPGNIGLLACTGQIFFPGKAKTAKYAGNWDPNAEQPWSYRLQKWILSNTFLTRNMTVLVYGNWHQRSKNILPFFTASFSEEEKGIISKSSSNTYRLLFVGNLVEGKNPLIAIKLLEQLKMKGIEVELEIYGEGTLRSILEKYVSEHDLIKNVKFKGNRKLKELKEAYKDAHFLILASKSEGWPKAVAEAMFFGCIPIATGVSCIQWMLGDGSRGILISSLEKRKENIEKKDPFGVEIGKKRVSSQVVVNETVERIIELMEKPEKMKKMSMEAQKWSQEYTLEKFENEIKKIINSVGKSDKKSSFPAGRDGGEG